MARAPDEVGLTLTPIGIRDADPNQLETEILDVAGRHHSLFDSEVPTPDSEAVPVAQRE